MITMDTNDKLKWWFESYINQNSIQTYVKLIGDDNSVCWFRSRDDCVNQLNILLLLLLLIK